MGSAFTKTQTPLKRHIKTKHNKKKYTRVQADECDVPIVLTTGKLINPLWVYNEADPYNHLGFFADARLANTMWGFIEGACQSKLNTQYFIQEVIFSNAIIISKARQLRSPRARDGCGVILLRFDAQDRKVHVAVVCSNRASVGSALLRSVETYARRRQARIIELHAIPEVVGFYTQAGYEHKIDACDPTEIARHNIDEDGIYTMTKCIRNK